MNVKATVPLRITSEIFNDISSKGLFDNNDSVLIGVSPQLFWNLILSPMYTDCVGDRLIVGSKTILFCLNSKYTVMSWDFETQYINK